MSRIYIGQIPNNVGRHEVERFLRGYGRIREVVMMKNYAFVELDDARDADDAVHELNGCSLAGSRVIVERPRLPPRFRRNRNFSPPRRQPPMKRFRGPKFGPPQRSDHRIIVDNLSSKISWQDLKDIMRKVGDVTFAGAHKTKRNEGVVEFSNSSDMRRAISKYHGYVLYGRKLRVFQDRERRSSSRSSSGSRGRRHHRSHKKSHHSRSRRHHSSHSKSASSKRSNSHDGSRGRKRSPNSHSRSPSPKRSNSRDGSRGRKRSPISHSRSPSPNRSNSRDGSRGRKRSPISHSRSPSPKRSNSRDGSRGRKRSPISRTRSPSPRKRSRVSTGSERERSREASVDSRHSRDVSPTGSKHSRNGSPSHAYQGDRDNQPGSESDRSVKEASRSPRSPEVDKPERGSSGNDSPKSLSP